MLKDKIQAIRQENKLTQDELAEKLFVTRQAVSRWENGKTTPTLETLKQISDLFAIDANDLIGTDRCNSCSWHYEHVDNLGTNADGGISEYYCSYCYQEGKFTEIISIDEMTEFNLGYLEDFNKANGTNYSPEEARTVLKGLLSTLKRWKND